MKLSFRGETADETMNTKNSIAQFGLKLTTVEEFIKSAVENK